MTAQTPTATATTVKIGDADPASETCTVVLSDAEGREIKVIDAPEDDLIPFMRDRGIYLGVYLGNSTYRVL